MYNKQNISKEYFYPKGALPIISINRLENLKYLQIKVHGESIVLLNLNKNLILIKPNCRRCGLNFKHDANFYNSTFCLSNEKFNHYLDKCY